MSKFSNLMHLLDLEHPDIVPRVWPHGTTPHTPHETCIIKLNPAELNPTCAKCRFARLVFTKGKVDELGIQGYMSDQKDGLKRVNLNPRAGINLRKPTTIIRAEGNVWLCGHPKQGLAGFLTEEDRPCDLFQPKEEPKKK